MIFLRGAKQLVTMRGPAPRRGAELLDLGVIQDGSVLIDGGRIDEVGSTRRIENLAKARGAKLIDVSGKVVLPGFVDSYTRLIFGAPRLEEFEAQASGVRRAEAGEAALRGKSSNALRAQARRWAYSSASYGATTAEIRSGHESSWEVEAKGLRAAQALNGDPLEIGVSLIVGAALAGRGDEEIASALGHLSRRKLAYACEVDFGALSPSRAKAALEAAKDLGLERKVWAMAPGAVELAVSSGALSADGLRGITGVEIDRLASSDTIATLLPGLTYHAGLAPPPARQLVDRGAVVAIASGFGPECPTLSMPLTVAAACRSLHLTPEEALACATINVAAAVGRAGEIGSLEPGKQADIAVFDVSDYREIPYYLGVNLCSLTLKRGQVIYRAGALPPVPKKVPSRHIRRRGPIAA